jgi:hypothetical protein
MNAIGNKKSQLNPIPIGLLLFAMIAPACGPALAGGNHSEYGFATLADPVSGISIDSVDSSKTEPRVEFIVSLDYARNIGRDLLHTVGAPVFWSGKDWTAFTVRTLAIAGTMTFLDRPIKDLSQNVRGDFTDHVADRFDRFGLN